MGKRAPRARKKSKRTWGKPPVPPPPDLRDRYGDLEVLGYSDKRSNRHRLVKVRDVVTGELGEVRADNLRLGNTLSLGRIKKARYAEHAERVITMREMNLDRLDPDNVREALGDNYYAVDVEGKPFRQTHKAKPGQGYQGTGKDRYGKYRDYYITKTGQLQVRSAESGYNFKDVDKEIEDGGHVL